MKSINRIIYMFLISLFIFSLSSAQDRRAGANGAPFLNVGIGARSVALGSATAAISNDVEQVFWNPAGVALKDQIVQASFNYNQWFADLNHNAAAVSYNFKDIGTIALGVITFGASDIPADRDIYPNNPDLWPYQIDKASGNTFNYLDLAVSVTYSKYVMDNLSLGVTAKLINQSIDDMSTSAIAFDIGTIYDIGMLNWKIAARMSNLGQDMTFYDFPYGIPLAFSIGTSIMPYSNDIAKLLLSVDAIKYQDSPQSFFAGGELTLLDILSLRGGYKINYSGTKDDGTTWRDPLETTIEGFSMGVGIHYPVSNYDLRVDYCYTSMDLFNGVHRISLNIGVR